MNTFLMWLGGILVAVLTALFAVPHFIDWNGYRGVFEEEASRIFGRDVRVGGSVNVRLLPTPYVRFEKLRIADTSGVTGAPLFSADNFTMWLSVPPLLKGVLEARRVELDKPVVRLAVDRAGRPNWTNLSIRPGALPFVPADVTLQSVFVSGGEIAYDAAGVGTLAHVKGIEGELSAGGLSGPFTFRGTVAADAGPREIRFTTGEIADDASTRLQVAVSDDPSNPGGPRHTLEGDVSGLDDKPSFKGALKSTARMSDARDAPAIDARADVEASTSAAKLENLIVAFETAGTPQIVTGSVGAAWGARHKVRVDLASRWLDLDRLAAPLGAGADKPAPGSGGSDQLEAPGAEAAAMPLSVARRLFTRLVGVLPAADDLDATVAIEQVSLGGEAVSDVRIVLRGEGGPLELRTLSAGLPGGARIDFSGHVTDTVTSDEAAVEGSVFAGGPSLARLIRWAVPSYERVSSLTDGPFSVNGRMMLGHREVTLSDATAELSGSPLRGSVVWRGGDSARFEVEAEGYEIDTRWFGMGSLRLADLLDTSPREPSPDAAGSTEGGTAGVPAKDAREHVRISLRAGRLLDGEDVLKDLDLALKASAKGLEIERLSFTTPEGFGLDLSGRFDGSRSSPSGEASFTASAASVDGGAVAGHLLWRQGFLDEHDARALQQLMRSFAPFRVAGTLGLGGGVNQLELELDGISRDGRVVTSLGLSKGLDDWRASPLTLNLDLATADAVDAVSRLVPHLAGREYGAAQAAPEVGAGDSGTPGRLLLALAGTPVTRLSLVGDARGEHIDATFDLTARLSEVGLAISSGTLEVGSAEAGDLLAMAGLDLADGAQPTPLAGRFELETDSGTLSVATSNARFGQAALAGRLAFTYPDDAGPGDGKPGDARDVPIAVAGDVSVDRLTLAGLMDAIVAEGARVAPPAQLASRPVPMPPSTLSDALTGGGPDVAEAFSDRPFDLSPAAGLSGRIDVAAKTLEIDRGLDVRDADFALVFDGKGGLKVELKKGSSPAGALSGTFDLSPATAASGAELSGSLTLSGGDLYRLLARPDGTSLAKGEAGIEATFSGRGLAPRALLTALQGQGTLKLTGASLAGLSPAEVSRAAEAVLSAPPEAGTAGDLLPQVRTAITAGELAFGAAEIPFRITDGAVRFAELSVRQGQGQEQGQEQAKGPGQSQGQGTTTGVTTVDLVRLAVDSAWKIEAPAQSGDKPAWPPAEVVWVGPLREVGTLAPRIDLSAFERELAVRKMERNVERLERLRAEDEARAAELQRRQEELERLREAEAARAREAVRQQLQRERAQQGETQPWQPAPTW